MEKLRERIILSKNSADNSAKIYNVLSMFLWWSITITTSFVAAFPQIAKHAELTPEIQSITISVFTACIGILTAANSWISPEKKYKKFKEITVKLDRLIYECDKYERNASVELYDNIENKYLRFAYNDEKKNE